MTYLREGTVVPQVTLVGEAVTDVTKLALLDVLLDGVEEFLLGDLEYGKYLSKPILLFFFFCLFPFHNNRVMIDRPEPSFVIGGKTGEGAEEGKG